VDGRTDGYGDEAHNLSVEESTTRTAQYYQSSIGAIACMKERKASRQSQMISFHVQYSLIETKLFLCALFV